jgi:hypothetical protein
MSFLLNNKSLLLNVDIVQELERDVTMNLII